MPERWTVSVTVIAVTGLLGLAMPAAAGVPNVVLSFYVPQAGAPEGAGVTTEGEVATRFFRLCPNNHGGTSLPNNARIKVVVRDGQGNPIAGIAAADICILFNGGTPGQGFSGVGADSVIANSVNNPSPLCPDVRCVSADAPTDVNGRTYITFAGADAANPGVTLRNPNRKWGHWDSQLPVYVLGFKLSGRLTSGALNGSYVLRIKNMDISGGLQSIPTPLNTGELVDAVDVNTIRARKDDNINVTQLFYYWSNLDGLCPRPPCGPDSSLWCPRPPPCGPDPSLWCPQPCVDGLCPPPGDCVDGLCLQPGDCVTQADLNILLAHFSSVAGTRHDCDFPLP